MRRSKESLLKDILAPPNNYLKSNYWVISSFLYKASQKLAFPPETSIRFPIIEVCGGKHIEKSEYWISDADLRRASHIKDLKGGEK